VLALTGPLAVTSANRSGEPTPETCAELSDVFGQGVAVYLCDLCDPEPLGGRPSTVVDLAGGTTRVLRAGAISDDEVADALCDVG